MRLQVESDSVEALESIISGNPLYDNIICDCRFLLNRLEVWELHHAYREQNQIANLMAKEGARYDHFGDKRVFVLPPPFIEEALCKDVSGPSFPRKQTTIKLSYSGRDVSSKQYIVTNFPNMQERWGIIGNSRTIT